MNKVDTNYANIKLKSVKNLNKSQKLFRVDLQNANI